MDRFLEDKLLSLISKDNNQQSKINGSEEGGGNTSRKQSLKQRLSIIATNLQTNCIQAESEVEDNNQKSEQQNSSTDSQEESLETLKFPFIKYPNIDKKHIKQYHAYNGYESDNNEDQQLQERSLRLCQFLLLLDNRPAYSTFQKDDQTKEKTTLGNLSSQNTIGIEKRLSNSLKLDGIEKNTSMVFDPMAAEDEQSNILTNQLIDQCPNLLIRNKMDSHQNGQLLRSFSLNMKKKQEKKNKIIHQRANSLDIQRDGGKKDDQNIMPSLKEFINNFINENRKCIIPNKKKLQLRQQSLRDLDFSEPQDYYKQYRRIYKVKQQMSYERGSIVVNQAQKSKNIVAHMNESDHQKKLGGLNVSSSFSITDENFSCSENEVRSNTASESGTPKNFKNIQQNYQKSKFHNSTKKHSDESKPDLQNFSQAQNLLDTEVSLDINNQFLKNIQQKTTEKAEIIKKEKQLQLILNFITQSQQFEP